jgi:hypothetical protein
VFPALLAALTALAGPDPHLLDLDVDLLDHEPAPTRFSTPRASWQIPPPDLRELQPRLARVWLELPPEWLPPRAVGIGVWARFTVLLDQGESWELAHGRALDFGLDKVGLALQVEDDARRVRGGVIALPRALVIELRFDVLGRLR